MALRTQTLTFERQASVDWMRNGSEVGCLVLDELIIYLFYAGVDSHSLFDLAIRLCWLIMR